MSKSKNNVVLTLAAAVRTEDGVRTVSRGEELPENTLPEERDRLDANGILGTAEHAAALPPAGVAEPVERATPIDAARAAIVAQETADLQEKAEQDVAEKIAELHADQQGEASGGSAAKPAPEAPGLNSENEAFDTYVAEASVEQIVAAVDAAPEDDRQALAQAYLEAEESVREGKPRVTLVEGLSERGASPAGS